MLSERYYVTERDQSDMCVVVSFKTSTYIASKGLMQVPPVCNGTRVVWGTRAASLVEIQQAHNAPIFYL